MPISKLREEKEVFAHFLLRALEKVLLRALIYSISHRGNVHFFAKHSILKLGTELHAVKVALSQVLEAEVHGDNFIELIIATLLIRFR